MREADNMKKLIKKLRFEATADTHERILGNVLQALEISEQQKSATPKPNIWRIIMKSPVMRIAAVLFLIVGIAVVKWQISGKPKHMSPNFSIFISTACAAEQTFFTGDNIVHITHEITLYPNTGAPDLAKKLDELIESNFVLSKNLAFMRGWFSSHASLPVYSLKPNGEYQWYTLELTGIADKAAVIQEHIWYDPDTGYFVRAFMQEAQLIFAIGYDGAAVYMTEAWDNGKFEIRREPITEEFSLPENPAEFLGISASFQGSMDKMNLPPIEEQSREQLADGRWLRVFKLRWPGTDAYHIFKVDVDDNTIEQIESVAYGWTIQQIRRISSNTVEAPGFSWNLAELAGQSSPLEPEVIITEGVTPVTPQQMADSAQVETYVLGSKPDWIKEQKCVILSDKVSPYGAAYVVFCSTNDGRCVAISQGRTVHHYISGLLNMSNQAGLRWFPNYMSQNRFKVHDVSTLGRIVGIAILTAVSDLTDDTGSKLWSSDALFKQLGFEPLPDYRIYMLDSPTDAYSSITFNGKFSDAEVRELIENLIPTRLYQSPDEAKDWYAKIDPGSVVYQGFKPGVFLKDWLVLGPIPVFDGSVSNADMFADGASQTAAFDREEFDIHTFQPVVSIDGKLYYWEKYSSGAEIIEFAWLYGYHGFADAYARAQIEMEEDTPVLLAIGDDDRIKVWLNGQLVHEDRDGGNLEVDKALVPVTLRKGLNDLILKVQNGIFEWEFSVRIFEADYDPATDVKKPDLESVTYPGLAQGEFMKEWLLLGPVPDGEGVEPKASFERDYLQSLETFQPVVKIDGIDYQWAYHRAYTGIIDLRRFWRNEPSTEKVSGYAWAQIDMPQETEALLGFGTDDAGRAWLNGELILDSWTDRGAFPDHDRVKVVFREGPNQLVIKVYNNLRNWKFCCRLLEK